MKSAAADPVRTLVLQPLGRRAEALLSREPVNVAALKRALGARRSTLLLSMIALAGQFSSKAARDRHLGRSDVRALLDAAERTHPRLFASESVRGAAHAGVVEEQSKAAKPATPRQRTQITEVHTVTEFATRAPQVLTELSILTKDAAPPLQLVLTPADLTAFARVSLDVFEHTLTLSRAQPAAAARPFAHSYVRESLTELRTQATRLLRMLSDTTVANPRKAPARRRKAIPRQR